MDVKPRFGRFARCRRLATAALTLCGSTTFFASDAGAAATAVIAGHVMFDGTGAFPADGIVCVNAASTAVETCASVDPATGEYTVSGLEPDTYFLFTYAADDEYVREYFGDAYAPELMTTIDVADGATMTADFNVGPGATISGTVTDQETGLPIEGIDVCTTRWPTQCTMTAADGTYTLTAVVPAPTTLEFAGSSESPYLGELWDDQIVYSDATEIVFTSPTEAKTGIDAQLSVGASIFGVVTGEDTGAPLASGTVCALRMSDFAIECAYFDATSVAEFGGYRLTKLRPGEYSIFFGDSPGYADEYWENQALPQDAILVTLAGSQSVELNAALTPVDDAATTTTFLPEVMPSGASTTTASPTTAAATTAQPTAMTSSVPTTTSAPTATTTTGPTTTAATSSTTTTAAAQVLGARQAAASPTARTGRSFAPMLVLASALLGLGSALVMAERRRGLGR